MAYLLYHESQVAALCAVHCLNTLLQGPVFTEVDLAQIAQELDAAERALLEGEGAGGQEEEGGNVDPSGMFSSQVLSQALAVWGLSITPITSPEMRGVAENPQEEQAFICNLQEHWFTVRRMGEDWYNFNSIYPAPEALGTFYLAAFLASLREQGYTIFVVRGKLPAPMQPTVAAPGRWFSPEEARMAQEHAADSRQRGRVNNAIEEAISRAAATGGSLQLRSRRGAAAAPQQAPGTWGSGEDFQGMGEDEDADLAAAIAASLQHAAPPAGGAAAGGSGAGHAGFGGMGGFEAGAGADQEDLDPDLAAAIAASLQDARPGGATSQPATHQQQQQQRSQNGPQLSGAGVQPGATASTAESVPLAQPQQPALEPLEAEPEPGEGIIELAFRLPTGGRAMRRFASSSPTSQLYSYLEAVHKLPRSSHQLFLFPRTAVPCSSVDTLQAAGLTHRCMLVAEQQR